MRLGGRRAWIPAAAFGCMCFVCALLIGLGTVSAHHRKTERISATEAAWWYCTTRGELCGRDSPPQIEADWQRRERRDTVLVLGLAFAGGCSLAFGAGILVGRPSTAGLDPLAEGPTNG